MKAFLGSLSLLNDRQRLSLTSLSFLVTLIVLSSSPNLYAFLAFLLAFLSYNFRRYLSFKREMTVLGNIGLGEKTKRELSSEVEEIRRDVEKALQVINIQQSLR